jgi:hypothetical protein
MMSKGDQSRAAWLVLANLALVVAAVVTASVPLTVAAVVGAVALAVAMALAIRDPGDPAAAGVVYGRRSAGVGARIASWLQVGQSREAPRRVPWAATGLAGVLMLVALAVFSDYSVMAVALLFLAALFILIVALFTMSVVLWSMARPPDSMLDDSGQLIGLPSRLRQGAQLLPMRLRSRPSRAADRLFLDVIEELETLLWQPGDVRPTALSFVQVAMHPQTATRVDSWMPLEDVAKEWAQRYAAETRDAYRMSGLVVVAIDSDPEVAPGRVRVCGAFREPENARVCARAWSALVGPSRSSGASQRQRLSVPAAAAPAATMLGHLPQDDDDLTVNFSALAQDRTRLIPQAAGGLHLQPCDPLGVPLPDAEPIRLAAGRSHLVGRAPQADVRFGQPHVSRRHAELLPAEDGWVVVDCSSSGTGLNGQRLTPGRPSPIRRGDVLQLGTPVDGVSATFMQVL